MSLGNLVRLRHRGENVPVDLREPWGAYCNNRVYTLIPALVWTGFFALFVGAQHLVSAIWNRFGG